MKRINIVSHTLLFFLLTAFGCNEEEAKIDKSTSDENYVEVALEQKQCEFDPDRKTISFFEDLTGIIRSQESARNKYYFKEIQENKYNYDGDLFPCNLPEEAKEGGLQIKFNGNLKELFDREDTSGYPIELTYLKVKIKPE